MGEFKRALTKEEISELYNDGKKQTIFCQRCKEPYINNKPIPTYPEARLLCGICEEAENNSLSKDLSQMRGNQRFSLKPEDSSSTDLKGGNQKMAEETKKPQEFTYGNVKLLVWNNQDSKGNEYQSYQIQKFYKDSEGNWKTTDSLSEVELLKAGYLISSYVSNIRFKNNNQ